MGIFRDKSETCVFEQYELEGERLERNQASFKFTAQLTRPPRGHPELTAPRTLGHSTTLDVGLSIYIPARIVKGTHTPRSAFTMLYKVIYDHSGHYDRLSSFARLTSCSPANKI